jgi:hypothetical protein
MKRLSYYVPALALALALFCGAAPAPAPAQKGPKVQPATTTGQTAQPAATTATTKQIYYYWYVVPLDLFNDYNSLSAEEWEWEVYYGGYICNTDPSGGTLLAEGYIDNTYPHDEPPSVYLYIHM